ncbi:MAG: hypothetical protein WA395_14200 [Nitrososphaeraceae archaeon]
MQDENVSKVYEYRLSSDIKRKLQTLRELELPLSIKNGFISSANKSEGWRHSSLVLIL